MKESDFAEDFSCLGLTPPASSQQVEDAYRRKVALYAENSLATYALFDCDGRQAQLTRLAEAYKRISENLLPTAFEEGTEEEVVGPDPAASPGRYLRAHRVQADLSLKEIADRTKISPMKLAQIEEERFDLLPAPVYLRGFVLAFARTLGLPDPEGISQIFLARHQERSAEL
jgi:cytoskeleton protein RodZ